MNFRTLISAAALTCIAGMAHAYPASVIVNGGFEDNNVANGDYRYQAGGLPTGVIAAPWVFDATTGVANHSSAWGGEAAVNTVAFLQGGLTGPGQFPAGTPSISQTFSASTRALRIAFELANRPNYGSEAVTVTLDGIDLNGSPITAPGVNFTLYEFMLEGITGSTHTLSFTGVNLQQSPDAGVFLDNIAVNDIPEPASLALVTAALLGGAAMRRQRKAKL